jgi:ubiquinone/menaquinone biosynthesis C-methylase UbiE
MSEKEEATLRSTKTFNAAADRFDAPPMSFWNYFGTQTVDRVKLAVGDRVLDVCCGSGASALPAAAIVGAEGSVLGVDLADRLLDLGRVKAQEENLSNINFQVGDFENLGFEDGSFDAIICVFGIFFVPDMAAGLKELWRMVRPGGKLAITIWGSTVFEPANSAFWEIIKEERLDLYRPTPPWQKINSAAALEGFLKDGNLTNIKIETETGYHQINSSEDWWTMVMGGGYRGTIDLLTPDEFDRVKKAMVNFIDDRDIRRLQFEVIYAIATKDK